MFADPIQNFRNNNARQGDKQDWIYLTLSLIASSVITFCVTDTLLKMCEKSLFN